MAAIDHRKTLKHLYAPSARAAALVEVPPLRFLMIDGRGDPNTAPEYPLAVSALFTLAYSLKFALKRELGLDYAVMPLEGLWWAEDMGQFRLGGRDAWQWTMLIAQPEEVTAERLAAACEAACKKVDPSVLARVRLETYHEGLSAQVLHRGPYAAEAPTIDALHAFIAAQGYVPTGKHHEIYLKDPQRTAPERLETVIRSRADVQDLRRGAQAAHGCGLPCAELASSCLVSPAPSRGNCRRLTGDTAALPSLAVLVNTGRDGNVRLRPSLPKLTEAGAAATRPPDGTHPRRAGAREGPGTSMAGGRRLTPGPPPRATVAGPPRDSRIARRTRQSGMRCSSAWRSRTTDGSRRRPTSTSPCTSA